MNEATRNFGLQEDSPCIDTGDPDGILDSDGTRADMGAFTTSSEFAVFLRGDADLDGEVQAIPDALYLLRWAFLDDAAPRCMDAADIDDSGVVHGITDPTYLFRWQFGGEPAPPAPGIENCGRDRTSDSITCEEPPTCH